MMLIKSIPAGKNPYGWISQNTYRLITGGLITYMMTKSGIDYTTGIHHADN